jgi:hypothetical protein
MRRITAGGTRLFTLQVSKWGGRFIIELGRAPAGPYAAIDGKAVGPEVLTTWHLWGRDRARVRAAIDDSEVWFDCTASLGDRLRRIAARLLRRPLMTPHERAAREVLTLLPECDRWWAGEDGLPHIRNFAEQS